MSTKVLLGDEAVAAGAIDAGLSTAYGYPGTPATEIMEFLQHYAQDTKAITAAWCSNEKTAYETALGVSLVGKRSLVIMKHVGLNIAADPFINSALLKINGGLVVAVADDPSIHSSQNEQDSRYYADFAKIICLEPNNHQEAYDMTREAFAISEQFHIPVMLRLVMRLAHARSMVKLEDNKLAQKSLRKAEDKWLWIAMPEFSRIMYANLLQQQQEFLSYSESSRFNKLTINRDFTDYAVITSGLGYSYYMENAEELINKPSHLHIGVYPIPVNLVRSLAQHVREIRVIEEGYPYIERYLRGLLPQQVVIHGKMDTWLPPMGELNPDLVRKALGLKEHQKFQGVILKLPARPPQFCSGCPHHDTYSLLHAAIANDKNVLVTSDIGCYTLAALPPLAIADSVVCMGASIGMAIGASGCGIHPVIATIGDSTFIHSGITALIDAVAINANMTVIILDNSTTAMTGGQNLQLSSDQLVELIKGIGIPSDHIHVIIPLKKYYEENLVILKNEINYRGLSVIISRRKCVRIR